MGTEGTGGTKALPTVPEIVPKVRVEIIELLPVSAKPGTARYGEKVRGYDLAVFSISGYGLKSLSF